MINPSNFSSSLEIKSSQIARIQKENDYTDVKS
jgi:hypothetical protein